LLTFVSHEVSDFGRIHFPGRDASGPPGFGTLVLGRYVADQVQGWFGHFSQVGSVSVTVNVHKKNPRTLKEKMVMDGRHFQAIVQERRQDRVHLVFLEHEIPHHYVHSRITLGHR